MFYTCVCQDWALGAMYTKITVALTFMGPDWWLKLAIEQLYQNGLRNINISHVVKVGAVVEETVQLKRICKGDS